MDCGWGESYTPPPSLFFSFSPPIGGSCTSHLPENVRNECRFDPAIIFLFFSLSFLSPSSHSEWLEQHDQKHPLRGRKEERGATFCEERRSISRFFFSPPLQSPQCVRPQPPRKSEERKNRDAHRHPPLSLSPPPFFPSPSPTYTTSHSNASEPPSLSSESYVAPYLSPQPSSLFFSSPPSALIPPQQDDRLLSNLSSFKFGNNRLRLFSFFFFSSPFPFFEDTEERSKLL